MILNCASIIHLSFFGPTTLWSTLFPSSKLSAPKIIDFPDPVSPVITEKPFLKSIDKKSIKIKYRLAKAILLTKTQGNKLESEKSQIQQEMVLISDELKQNQERMQTLIKTHESDKVQAEEKPIAEAVVRRRPQFNFSVRV